jgi:hypothetical protein
VRLPWRLKWTLAQFAQHAEYRKHSAVLKSALAFYYTTLKKLVPGLSPEMKYLALADGHVIPVRDFMTLYIYKEIFVDRCYDLALDQPAPVIVDIGANSGLFALRLKQLYPSAKISCYEFCAASEHDFRQQAWLGHPAPEGGRRPPGAGEALHP